MPVTSPTSGLIDPVVQAQLSFGEATLAEFMDGLSKSISRYNSLLAKALPQNPKAHFYYYNENEEEEEKKKKPQDATAEYLAPTEEKKQKTDGDEESAAASESKTPAKQPQSPLLRRPQLPKSEMTKIKEEAKEELMKRQKSVGDFPIVGDDNEGEKSVKAHTSKTVADAKKKHGGHAAHGHHHVKKAHAKHGEKEKEKKEEDAEGDHAEEDDKKEVAKKTPAKKKSDKEPRSILPNLFDQKKKKGEKKKEEKDAESPKVVLTAEEAALDEDDWEDEEEEEEGGDMTVEQLFAKIAPSPQLLQEIRILKKEARGLNETFEIIHDWIAMNLPALATEDQEGTAVMAAVIESLSGFMSTIGDIYDTEAEYLEERAGLELSFLQNPELATGLALISILDNDTWDGIEAGYRALIRCHLIAHSQLAKNMEQLRTPIRNRINLSM